MKKIVSIRKKPVKLGIITLKYLEEICVNDSDIPEYIQTKIDILQNLGAIKVYNYIDSEIYSGVKFTSEETNDIQQLPNEKIDGTRVIIEEIREDENTQEVIDEPSSEATIEETIEPAIEITDTTKKTRGRPKKVVEESDTEEKEGNE